MTLNMIDKKPFSNYKITYLKAIMILSFILILIAPTALNASDQQTKTLYLFYSISCPHCRQALVFLTKFSKEHSDLIIKKYEISKNKENKEKFLKICINLGIVVPGIPLFIVGDKYVIGFDDRNKNYQYKVEKIVYPDKFPKINSN